MKIDIRDTQVTETAYSVQDAIGTIKGWFASDGFDQTTRDAYATAAADIEAPQDAAGLQGYANVLCQAAAERTGHDDFQGHGNYRVTAADEAGLHLDIDIEEAQPSPGLDWITPPEEQGQIVTTSFADDADQECWWMRDVDRSIEEGEPGREMLWRCRWGDSDDEFEPWNTAPECDWERVG